MSIKKFLLTTQEGDTEESTIDSYGNQTISYDDVGQKIVISNAYVIGNLHISGSIFGSLTGSLSGSSSNANSISSVSSSGNIIGSGIDGDPITLKNNISLNSVTASFSGDGSRITGLAASQISGIISSVVSSGSITGSGTINNPLALKENISLTSVTASFSGDGSGIYNIIASTIFRTSSQPLVAGDVISIGQLGLARCEKTNNLLSNAIGVVQSSGSEGVYIQTSGEIIVDIDGSYSTGSIVYAGNNGNACTYDEIMSGEYITQIGIVTGNQPGAIFISPRIFGQKG